MKKLLLILLILFVYNSNAQHWFYKHYMDEYGFPTNSYYITQLNTHGTYSDLNDINKLYTETVICRKNKISKDVLVAFYLYENGKIPCVGDIYSKSVYTITINHDSTTSVYSLLACDEVIYMEINNTNSFINLLITKKQILHCVIDINSKDICRSYFFTINTKGFNKALNKIKKI